MGKIKYYYFDLPRILSKKIQWSSNMPQSNVESFYRIFIRMNEHVNYKWCNLRLTFSSVFIAITQRKLTKGSFISQYDAFILYILLLILIFLIFILLYIVLRNEIIYDKMFLIFDMFVFISTSNYDLTNFFKN